MPSIYLDHNATTPMLLEVAEAMAECHAAGYANPASQHEPGRKARQALEDAREGIAEILGADLQCQGPDTLVFTSGGTEANNLAILGLSGGGRVVVSAIEHPSVMEAAQKLRRRGQPVATLAVSSDGVVREHSVSRLLSGPTRLLSVMLGNNETGVIQPVRELAKACRANGVLMHTDAVQAAGKIRVRFRELGIDAMTVAAHKFHGPLGIGALILRGGISPQPRLFGGVQQAGLRPGTESVALAVGMHRALQLWRRDEDARTQHLATLRDRLQSLLEQGDPNIVVHSADTPRLPQTLCVAFPGLDRQALVMALDMAGVACSTGSACASGSTDPSPTLVAMGCSEELLNSSIRLSVGATTTAAEVDQAARLILGVCNDLRQRSKGGKMAVTARRQR